MATGMRRNHTPKCKNYTHELLKDSKQLKKKDRLTLQNDIVRDAIAWAVAEVSCEEID